MPNIKSAKKRVSTAQVRTLRNKMINSSVKTTIKKFEAAIAQKDITNANALYNELVKSIDMAASKGTLHKNAANRKKSRLAIRLHSIENENAPTA